VHQQPLHPKDSPCRRTQDLIRGPVGANACMHCKERRGLRLMVMMMNMMMVMVMTMVMMMMVMMMVTMMVMMTVVTAATTAPTTAALQGRSFYILYKEGACQPMLMLRMSI
jgi:hypothetical protein